MIKNKQETMKKKTLTGIVLGTGGALAAGAYAGRAYEKRQNPVVPEKGVRVDNNDEQLYNFLRKALQMDRNKLRNRLRNVGVSTNKLTYKTRNGTEQTRTLKPHEIERLKKLRSLFDVLFHQLDNREANIAEKSAKIADLQQELNTINTNLGTNVKPEIAKENIVLKAENQELRTQVASLKQKIMLLQSTYNQNINNRNRVISSLKIKLKQQGTSPQSQSLLQQAQQSISGLFGSGAPPGKKID